MAEVTRKRRGEIIKKVFEILLQNPEGLAPKELFPQAEKSLTLSNYEKSDYPNRPGVRRFENIVRFLTISQSRQDG
jgi:restriction system protein